MPEGSVVILSPIPWAGLWTSRHALATELARLGMPVLFVDPPRNALRRPVPAAREHPPLVDIVEPPPHLPYGVLGHLGPVQRAVVAVNAVRYARFVKEAARRLTRPLLLVNSFMPVLGYRVAAVLRPERFVYHRADEMRSFPDAQRVHLALERRVAREADAVVCVTPAVRDGIADVRPDATLLPNGVDAGRFEGASPDPDVATLPRPIAVLVGAVDRRVDPALLAAAAEGAATLVLAGPVSIEVPASVHALGPVPPDRVPALLAAADVAVVCYEATTPGDALKIYEYLAAGLPVVTGDFPGLANVRDAVRVVANPAEMTAAVRDEAARRSVGGDRDRRAVAARHTWAARARALLDAAAAAP